ncbi:MAG: RNA 2',3'-cyclic phosphodiesterase [Desulfobacterium sp.]|nr:RNA 2',3'-cyclic phosphodiesterase [Desulfobacterium sp.]MBU3947423.1 RNA 2',3'-cyclic phosphodiesterase [Pseudomonadota bacterium]MBU4035462.1 RNA 2',3'-cyclic phosphodiesterase [Pseudomonadota bacterium]
MSDTIRAFIALKLPENILTSIKNIQKDLKQYGFPVRWVKPENIHLTLKFFGNIDESDVANAKAAVSDCADNFSPLSLFAKGIGVFPTIMRPRVIWVGISGEIPLLLSLQNTLEKRLEEYGFKKEERPFQGHLTLGRFKDKANNGKLIEAIRKYQKFDSEVFTAQEFVLFKSDLKPQGPVYTELLNVLLAKKIG